MTTLRRWWRFSFAIPYGRFDSWTPPNMLQLTLTIPMLFTGLYVCRPRVVEDELT